MIKHLMIWTLCLLAATSASAQLPQMLGDNHAMMHIDVTGKYLLLPVQEKEENASIRVVADNEQRQALNVRLAVDKVDYYVPLDLGRLNCRTVLLDDRPQRPPHHRAGARLCVLERDATKRHI